MASSPTDDEDPQHVVDETAPTGAPAGDEAVAVPEVAVAYEIVYECRDKMLGARLAQRLEDVVGPTWQIRRVEEGPVWAVAIEFPSGSSAERFFDSEFYRQFCIEARRSCRSSVLVVPKGPIGA